MTILLYTVYKVELLQITESLETLKADCKNGPAKEHFTFALRSLELVQPAEIEQLMETVLGVSI